MSYQNPTSTQYMPPQPPKTSGAAITSLVCGLLLCIPFITQLIAIVTGIIGLRASGKPGVGGRGLAIAGLILGIIGLIGWGIGGGAIATAATWIIKESKPVVAHCETFTRDLTSGNVDAAAPKVDPGITKEKLQEISERTKSWGPLKKFSINSRNVELLPGGRYWTFEGSAEFTNGGVKRNRFLVHEQPDGTAKITEFDLDR